MCLILVDGTLVSRNNLLATVSTLGPSYRVYLKLYINSFDGDNLKSGKWAELLRLTRTNKNCCSIGDRIPLILTNKGGFIQVATQIGSSGNNWKNVNLNARTWYRLEIVQYEHNDKVLIISLEKNAIIHKNQNVFFQHFNVIKLNGRVVRKVENRNPRTYNNVKVWAAKAAFGFPAADAYIKDLVYENLGKNLV